MAKPADAKLRAYLRQRMRGMTPALDAAPTPAQRRRLRKTENRAKAWQRRADQLRDRTL